LLRRKPTASFDGLPSIVVLNHPSWWDPLVGLMVARRFPGREHFAPIDARALGKYKFFEKLGFFGVEQNTAHGVRTFLRTSEAILSRPNGMLWITAQGRFTDVRDRPLDLRPGVAHLARRLDRAVILPLALEYTFWEEKLPEALVHFGDPISIAAGSARSVEEWLTCIEQGLTATQDALALAARRRDPSEFEVLVSGKIGVSLVYDTWRAFWARLRGQTFRAAHNESDVP
jgi:1-acyl-sn-glycerol-3-phosphate acyltransferase